MNRHAKSQTHKRNLKISGKSQKTLHTTFPIPNVARLENVSLIRDWVGACAASNIPFNVTDNAVMRNFFRERVISGGSIPKRRGLTPYLEDAYKSKLASLKIRIQGKKIMIFYDETYDSQGRFVSCILQVLFVTMMFFTKRITHNGRCNQRFSRVTRTA